MSTYSLYLDDVRDPKAQAPYGEWVIARSVDEAMKVIIVRGVPNHISFDHDLGDGPTGYNFVNSLWVYLDETLFVKGKNLLPDNFTYSVHSTNPVGAKRIRDAMEEALGTWKDWEPKDA